MSFFDLNATGEAARAREEAAEAAGRFRKATVSEEAGRFIAGMGLNLRQRLSTLGSLATRLSESSTS